MTARRVALAIAMALATTVLVVGGVFAWAIFGGGGPLMWFGAVRPVYVPPDYTQSGNTFCSPPGGFDQLCMSFMGPWTHDPEQAYGGLPAEYARIADMSDCDALRDYVLATEAEMRTDGPLAGRAPVPEQGYLIAAGLREQELACSD